jgi:hypothetical protein
MCNFILNGRWFFNIFLNRNRSWGSTIWIWEIIFSSLPNFFILFYTIFVIDSKLFSHSSFWVLGLYRWEHLVNWFISMIIELSGHNELIQEAHESNLQISGFLWIIHSLNQIKLSFFVESFLCFLCSKALLRISII